MDMSLCLLLFQPLDSYTATKSEGEAAIIKANGANGLRTCSLRPSSIFGPGDRLFVPSLVAAARAGKSKVIMVLPHFNAIYCLGIVSSRYKNLECLSQHDNHIILITSLFLNFSSQIVLSV